VSRGDIQKLSFADAHAGLVDELGEFEHALGGESAQALHGQTRCREHPVAGVDRLRHAPHAPHGRPVVTRGILVLDVVVDQGEVVEQLDRGGRRQRRARVAGEGLVNEGAEHRSQPLPGGASLGLEAEVVQHHPVEGLKRRVRAD